MSAMRATRTLVEPPARFPGSSSFKSAGRKTARRSSSPPSTRRSRKGTSSTAWLPASRATTTNSKAALPVRTSAPAHARGFGLFKRPEDFDDVLTKVEKVSDGGHIHAHFSGVEHADGNELRYTPIKKGDLRFEPLAECLLDEDYDLTIVSSSPLLEHDAMYMKVILERVLAKRLMRPTKPEKEEKEERGAKRR